MAHVQRRHQVTAVENGDCHNAVAPGWRLYPEVRRFALRGNYRPPRHGNWRHGCYSREARAALLKVGFCRVLLKQGLDRWPDGVPIPPEMVVPPGWRMFLLIRHHGVVAPRQGKRPTSGKSG